MKKQWKWVIGAVAFCILAPVVSTAVSVEVRWHAEDSGRVIASSFLADLRNHKYELAHALMAPSEQAVISVTVLQQGQQQIETKHGQWLAPALELERHSNEALDHITYFYEVAVERDKGMPMMVRMIQTGSGWRVLEYHYDENAA